MEAWGWKVEMLVKQLDARASRSSDGQWPCLSLAWLNIYTAVSGLGYINSGQPPRLPQRVTTANCHQHKLAQSDLTLELVGGLLWTRLKANKALVLWRAKYGLSLLWTLALTGVVLISSQLLIVWLLNVPAFNSKIQVSAHWDILIRLLRI